MLVKLNLTDAIMIIKFTVIVPVLIRYIKRLSDAYVKEHTLHVSGLYF